MTKLSEEELLEWLRCRFCNEGTPCDGCIRLKQGCCEKQAYKEIKEILQRPQHDEKTERELQEIYSDKKPKVTNKWIKEKATELYNYLYYETFSIDQVKDFIRLLVAEIRGK